MEEYVLEYYHVYRILTFVGIPHTTTTMHINTRFTHVGLKDLVCLWICCFVSFCEENRSSAVLWVMEFTGSLFKYFSIIRLLYYMIIIYYANMCVCCCVGLAGDVCEFSLMPFTVLWMESRFYLMWWQCNDLIDCVR